jgi:hypothetical protein
MVVDFGTMLFELEEMAMGFTLSGFLVTDLLALVRLVDFLATTFLPSFFSATFLLIGVTFELLTKTGFLATTFLATGFLATTFLATGFLATAFLAKGLAAGLTDDFVVAEVTFFATTFFAAGFLATGFLAGDEGDAMRVTSLSLRTRLFERDNATTIENDFSEGTTDNIYYLIKMFKFDKGVFRFLYQQEGCF